MINKLMWSGVESSHAQISQWVSWKSLLLTGEWLETDVFTVVVKCLAGQCFVVEEDIREFTQTKVDKRFQGILNMLRHCQRLRELRGGGLTRYMLLWINATQ